MTMCPLCGNEKYFVLNSYALTALGQSWLREFKKNPFNDSQENACLKKLKCGECDLVYFDPPVYGDTLFYEHLSKYPWYYEEDKWEYYEAINIIAKYKPSKLLEVGCGSGNFLEKVMAFTESAQGLEINRKALDQCRAKKISVFPADITAPSDTFVDGSRKYDMILLFQVLEHLENLDVVFSRLDALLNRDGLLVIAVPNPESYLKEMDNVLLDMPPHHNTGWSFKSFKFISEKYRWPVVEYKVEPIRYVHYMAYLKAIAHKITFSQRSLKSQVRSFMNSLVINLFAPFYYTADRQHLSGQTHMIVLRKTNQE